MMISKRIQQWIKEEGLTLRKGYHSTYKWKPNRYIYHAHNSKLVVHTDAMAPEIAMKFKWIYGDSEVYLYLL